MTLVSLSHGFFILFFAYFSLVMSYYLFLGLMALLESYRRRKQDDSEEPGVFFVSTFSIPVTVLVPAHNEEVWIKDVVQAILKLNYPEFEVIVIDDGSTDGTMAALRDLLDLDSVHQPYIDEFDAGRIKGIYRSRRHPQVRVLSKEGGQKKAGALNAGLNLARYKYICVIDADTILEPDALLKVMTQVQKDPENIAGVGSYFGLLNGFEVKDGVIVSRNFTKKPLIAYQNLEYIRSFIGNRISWSRMKATPFIAGGFAVWRRDVVVSSGGFSPDYSSEDVEFSFRVRECGKRAGQEYKLLMLPYVMGWTLGPSTVGSFILQRNRWQRVANEAVSKYSHMIFNPRYGAFGCFTLPYFLFYEVLGGFFELASLLIVITGFVFGFLSFKVFSTFLVFVLISQAFISLLSLFIFYRQTRLLTPGMIFYLGALSILEFFWYRWIILFAKLQGSFAFLARIRTFDQFVRLHKDAC
ncbi:MAG: glycosyltransferase [Candidatus Omnitrophota bacterium]